MSAKTQVTNRVLRLLPRVDQKPSLQMIWLTSPPIAVECHGALMVEGMDKEGMRFNVMEANLMVATAAASFGYDVLDLHHMLMHQV